MTEKRYRWHVIHDRIKDISSPIGAEIGVHRGECSGHLLELHPGLKLYMIDMWSPDTYKGKGDDAATGPYRKIYQDNWEDNRRLAYESVKKHEHRFAFIQEKSLKACDVFENESLDFAFIDGAHDYESVKADIIAWRGKIKPGGWLIMHDYDNPSFPGVRQAVEEMFSEFDGDSDYIAAVRV